MYDKSRKSVIRGLDVLKKKNIPMAGYCAVYEIV